MLLNHLVTRGKCTTTGAMKSSALVLLCLLWSLMKVHTQTFPNVAFKGETLPNHAYVDLSLVGNGSDSVQCHTDLVTCCSVKQDMNGSHHRGDWTPPDSDSRLPFYSEANSDIYESRDDKRVEIHRENNAVVPSGIYRCDIPTNAVHHLTDNSLRESIHVGLYAIGGILSPHAVLSSFFCTTSLSRRYYNIFWYVIQ